MKFNIEPMKHAFKEEVKNATWWNDPVMTASCIGDVINEITEEMEVIKRLVKIVTEYRRVPNEFIITDDNFLQTIDAAKLPELDDAWFSVDMGLCCNIETLTETEHFHNVMPCWGKHSGNSLFPVPYPEELNLLDEPVKEAAHHAYINSENLYIGLYGKNRLELLNFLYVGLRVYRQMFINERGKL